MFTRKSLVIDIYLYNVDICKGKIIWYVTLLCEIQSEHNWTMDFCIILQDLQSNHLKDLSQLKATVGSPYMHNIELIMWEVIAKRSCPLYPVKEKKELILLNMTAQKVFTSYTLLNEKPHDDIINQYVRGAYLHCEGLMTFQNAIPYQQAPQNTPTKFWFHTLLKSSELTNIDILLKTSKGVYSCASGGPKPKKMKQAEDLDLLDIFVPTVHNVHIKEEIYSLLLIRPIFDYLWINEESEWNGCLAEFFRALFCKVYQHFKGVKPLYTYLLPPALTKPTCFPAYFSSFPLIPIFFGNPHKCTLGNILKPRDYIVTETDKIKEMGLVDVLFGLKKNGVMSVSFPDTCMWPLWTRELNQTRVDEENNCLIYVNQGVTLINIDIKSVLHKIVGLPPDITLLEAMSLEQQTLTCRIKKAYNAILLLLLKIFKNVGATWLCINESIITCQLPENNDVTEILFSFFQGLHLEMDDYNHIIQYKTTHKGIMFQDHTTGLIFSTLSYSYTDATQFELCNSWLETVRLGLYYLIADIWDLHTLLCKTLSVFIAQKYNSCFWALLPGMYNNPICPPLPYDCKQLIPYIMTESGPVAWWKDFPSPTKIALQFYYTKAFELYHITKNETTLNIETFLNVITLL